MRPTYLLPWPGRVVPLDDEPDNPAFGETNGHVCPACEAPALSRWFGGFPDEPPALPHAECRLCGWTA
jgi:hypothetical protein